MRVLTCPRFSRSRQRVRFLVLGIEALGFEVWVLGKMRA